MYLFTIIIFFATPVSAPLWNIESFSAGSVPYRFALPSSPAHGSSQQQLTGWPGGECRDRRFYRVIVVNGGHRFFRLRLRISLNRSFTNEATTTVADEYMQFG